MNDKRIDCEVCGKSVKKSRKKEHMRVHTGEKPYVCELCGELFRYRTNMTTHVKNIHLRPKYPHPIKCPVCPYKFKEARDMIGHYDACHGVCDECGLSREYQDRNDCCSRWLRAELR